MQNRPVTQIQVEVNETITVLSTPYRAKLKDQPGIAVLGATLEEAVGDLLQTHRSTIFGWGEVWIIGPLGTRVNIATLGKSTLGLLALRCPELFNLSISQ